MKNFAQEKNGYNKKDVDLYIINIEKELEEANAKIKSLNEQIFSLSENLEYYKEKENIINKSIESAVEAGEIIKEQSKSFYKEEISKLKILYKRWNTFLNKLQSEYPNASINEENNIVLKSLSEAINDVLEINVKEKKYQIIEKSCQNLKKYQKTIISNEKSGSQNNYKNVIVRNKRPSQKTLLEDKVEKQFKKESQRLNLSSVKKSFNKFNFETDKENFLEDYLNKNIDNEVAFAYKKEIVLNKSNNLYPIPNSSGFDLKEAVNPTMELEEIMKSFDLED